MPKKLNPDAKPFQPIEKAFVREALAETPPAPSDAPPARTEESRVVHLPRGGGAAPERDDEPAPRSAPHPDRLTRVLKAKVSTNEHVELTRLVNELSLELETPVSTTHVIRALITILRHAEPEVQRRAKQNGPLRRPPNDDLTAIAAFEFRLAKLLSAALRDSKPLRELSRE